MATIGEACAHTLSRAEVHAPVVVLQWLYRLLLGLGFQLAAVPVNKLLLVGAVRQGQQALHQLQEAGVLGRRNTAWSHDLLSHRREARRQEVVLRRWARQAPLAATPAPPC